MDKVVFIEFNDDGRPFSVCVRREGDGVAFDDYDVEYRKASGNLYARHSGTGYKPEVCLGSSRRNFWAGPGILVTVSRWPEEIYVPAPESYRVELPAKYAGELWSWAVEGRCEWCSVCEDWMPIENAVLCEHIWYCDECGEWSTPEERCDCKCEE